MLVARGLTKQGTRLSLGFFHRRTNSLKTTRRRNDPGLIVAAAVSSVATLVLAGLVAFYACRRPADRDLEGPVEIKTPPHEETKHSA